MDHIRMECNKINWKTCMMGGDEWKPDEMCEMCFGSFDLNSVSWLFAYAQTFDTEAMCNGTLGACKDYCENYCENFADYEPDYQTRPDEHITGGKFHGYICAYKEKYVKIEDLIKTDHDLDQYLSNYAKGTDCTQE